MLIAAIVLLVVVVVVLCVLLVQGRQQLLATRKSDRMKKAFMQNISREIKVPLKAVGEMAETVAKEGLYLSKSEKRNIADQLIYNAQLVSTLMDEVMLFSDIKLDGHRLKDEMFSPNALCRRCLQANMNSIYHVQAVKLSFRHELNDEFFVKSDKHMTELILNKLILNACRFTEKGEVSMGCNLNEHPGFLTIYVADTGVGIPEQRVGFLFSWFDEPDNMHDEAELDLSICQKLAEKLGGSIRLDERRQHGTRVMLLLPLNK